MRKSPCWLGARRRSTHPTKAWQSISTVKRGSGVPAARELVVPFGRSAYVMRDAHLPDTEEIAILRIWHGREAR